MSGILVIRGGAIGDFILTLPAIGLLRENFGALPLEILGYRHIVALAEGRHYATAARSIEYAGLASFFVPGGKLPEDLSAYFSQFGQVISYLYDPDGFFEDNLRRAGVRHLISAYTVIGPHTHASHQLARPLEQLALYLEPGGEQAVVHPSAEDRAAARELLGEGAGVPLVAIHPGSGGKHKLWPLEHWGAVLAYLASHPARPRVLLIGGEADEERFRVLAGSGFPAHRLIPARHRPLPQLAALLERATLFLGHDSGISHLAAAVGAPSLLLFGPTQRRVWAPAGPHVEVLEAPGGDLALLPVEALLVEIEARL